VRLFAKGVCRLERSGLAPVDQFGVHQPWVCHRQTELSLDAFATRVL